MAYGLHLFDHPSRFVFEDDLKAFVDSAWRLKLRRLNAAQTQYDPFGRYYETTVILPNWKPQALRGLFGFYPMEITWGGVGPSANVSPSYFGYGAFANGAPLVEPTLVPYGHGTGLHPLGPDHHYPDVFGFGFRVGDGRMKSYEYGGSVTYRLSPDDGATWLVWDTGAWQEAVGPLATRWNTVFEADEGFNVFPFNRSDPQIRLAVKLTPSTDGQRTPGLQGVLYFVDYRYNHNEDMFRSVKRYLDGILAVSTKWTDPSANGVTTFQVDHNWDHLTSPVEVFNLTDDPTMTTNLYSALTGDGRGIILSSPQTGVLSAELFAVPRVFITAEEIFYNTNNPSVVAFIPTATEERELRQGHLLNEISNGRRVARATYHQTYHRSTIRLTSFSNKHHEAVAMNDALERALTQYRDLTSLALDTVFAIVGASPMDDLNRVGTALYAKNFQIEVVARTFLRPDFAIDIPFVEEFNVMLRPVSAPRQSVWSES